MKNVTERFLKYVQYPTQSDDTCKSCPSTKGQVEFARALAKECRNIGLSDVEVDEHSYVYATLPSNTSQAAPVIGFIAHMDTSPDAPGENVKPNLIPCYDGNDILLNGVTLSPKVFPALLKYKGESIITSDGKTLLGADDKAGIAEILTAMEYLIAHPEIAHGAIKIAFTPDEEIGNGAALFSVPKFGADFGYTIDGGRLGELEFENFNAAKAYITIQGKSVHPGTAKGAMVNALLIAAEIVGKFPANETPATTENYEGFFHINALNATVSHAALSILIRDFDMDSFEKRKKLIEDIVAETNEKYKNSTEVTFHEEYLNMAPKLENHMDIIELAKNAMIQQGITPIIQPIRGGTDGARLSYNGLPCPNLFTGGYNFHGPYEFIPVSSMEKAVAVIVSIVSSAVKE